ncbi:hypothetical protein NDR87_28365 [Nocardia sp. CDC159]|uniref:Uncharacterized protein n=1 Tax=Nocardia pulmonis TaxID=2951408 RepID=A0A9X2EE87_9NOCA|nr:MULTISPECIES: hypothetical protein [Nocardia]MCM6777408.1 hypothetical protein [Nocardia pulmonis]MCM6790293.1 hypothetical protein [Nocardia sp. CDC159]
MSLMLPINFAWSSESSALQLDLMAYTLPRSIAAGVIIALVVAVFATTVNHGLAAWGAALFGIVIMYVNHVAGQHAGPVTSLSTLNYVDSIAAGILFGGIATAVLHGRPQVFGWTLGALSSVVIGTAVPAPHGEAHSTGLGTVYSPTGDTPPLWLIVVTMIVVAVGTVLNRHRSGIERRSFELPMAPILAGTLFVGVTLFGTEWLAHHGDNLVDIGTAALATVVAGMIAAMLLPRRDGTLVLLTIALSGVGATLLPSAVPTWTAIPLIAVVAGGILLGFRRPAPMAALAAFAATAVLGALTAGGAASPVRTAAFSIVLAALSGYCFSSAAPRYNPTRVLGMAIVFVPSVVVALRDHPSRNDYGTVTVENGHWYYTQTPTPDSPTPYWTAFAITIACVIGLIALRRWRAPTIPGTRGKAAES